MSVTVLGIDTSNYTTSLALVRDGEVVANLKKLLDVGKGERGIRQSDAVFQHTKNLPLLYEQLGNVKIDAIGVSARPRDVEGSYMPCFLAGIASAKAASTVAAVNCYEFSHQAGHVMAALYSCGHTELADKRFIAFHVSGGTTEMLLVDGMRIERIGGTLDLNAGQLIDRIGVRLGFSFPCGREMEAAVESLDGAGCSSCVRGLDCHLSGLENQAEQLISSGTEGSLVAAFVIKSVMRTIDKLTENAIKVYGDLPLVFAGGVMSNRFVKDHISKKYGAFFAEPEFSCDNAAGCALLAYRKYTLT